jgi:hypothetical protein
MCGYPSDDGQHQKSEEPFFSHIRFKGSKQKGLMFCQTNLAFEQTTVSGHNACSLF